MNIFRIKQKQFVTFASWFLFAEGIVLWTLPARWLPSFYDPHYMATAAFFGIAAIFLIPKALRVSEHAADAAKKNHAVDTFQFLLAACIMANAIGELGPYQLYRVGFQTDKLLHFCISFAGAFAIPALMRDRFGFRRTSSFILVLIGMIIAGLVWEFYEFITDFLLHTRLFGIYGTHLTDDTIFDILSDVLGASLGTLSVMFDIGRRWRA